MIKSLLNRIGESIPFLSVRTRKISVSPKPQEEKNSMFHTAYAYTGRHDKGRYVYEKYKSIFDNGSSIIDVGADQGNIKQWLPTGMAYYTLGYGPDMSMVYNLEQLPWPLVDESFDIVLCLDVLEHLENIHAAFDECCRIAKQSIIISLPNPYACFMAFLHNGKYLGRTKDMKFYGLTPEPEEDRHRWFFSPSDAREFIRYRSEKNGFTILQYDAEGTVRQHGDHPLRKIFRLDLPTEDLECGTMWWILKRN